MLLLGRRPPSTAAATTAACTDRPTALYRIHWPHERRFQLVVVLLQGVLLVVFDQRLQRFVHVEWLREAVATICLIDNTVIGDAVVGDREREMAQTARPNQECSGRRAVQLLLRLVPVEGRQEPGRLVVVWQLDVSRPYADSALPNLL